MAKKAASELDPSYTGTERVVVLAGPVEFLKTVHLRRLREALEAKVDTGEVETIHFDGKAAGLSDVLDELRSFGMMQQYKLVVVDDADDFVTKHREALERYCDDPVEIGTLVLRPGTWNASWRLSKAAAKIGAVHKCEPPTDAEARKWIEQCAKDEFGVTLEKRAGDLLIERLGSDLGLLVNELGKLVVGVERGGKVTAEQVEALVGRASDEQAWDIQEPMLNGRAEAAILKLHELIELARQPDVLVTYFVADMVRKLHHASVLLSRGGRDFEICQQMKVWGDRQKPFMAAARKLGPRRTARLLGQVVEMDRRAKSGYGQTTRNLERFCVQFAEALR